MENDELNHATATYFLIDQPKEFWIYARLEFIDYKTIFEKSYDE